MSSLIKRTFTNAFWLFISEICAKGAMFVATLYLARVLGVAGFGLFSLGLAVGVYLWALVDLGVSAYGVRQIAQYRDQSEELLNLLNSMRLTLALFCMATLVVGAFIVNASSTMVLILLAGSMYTLFNSMSAEWLLKGIERMEYLALGNGVMALSFLAAAFIFIKRPDDAVPAVFYRSFSVFVGSIVTLIAVARAEKLQFVFSISFKQWLHHLRESLFFALNLGINNVTPFIPIFYLGAWLSPQEVGLFSAPQRLVLLTINAAAVIPMASYPILSKLYISDRETFNRAHKSFERVMISIGLPIAALAMILDRKIIFALFGSDYSEAASPFSIIIWLVPLFFLRANYGLTLLSAGFHRFNMFATASGALVTLFICLVGIPAFGLFAASWSLILGEVVTLFAMRLLFQFKVCSTKFFDVYFLKLVVVVATMFLFLKLLQLSLLPSIIVGIILYGLLSILSGLIVKQDLRIIWHGITSRTHNQI